MPHAQHGECCVQTGLCAQNHLPETSNEVNGAEDCTSRSADFASAFPNILHGIFVCVGLIVEGPEVLHQNHVPVLLHDGKDGAVVATGGWPNESQLEPFQDVRFEIRGLQGNLMHQGVYVAKVELDLTHGLVVFKEHIWIQFLVFFWHL
jgi:hypothetical protein